MLQNEALFYLLFCIGFVGPFFDVIIVLLMPNNFLPALLLLILILK